MKKTISNKIRLILVLFVITIVIISSLISNTIIDNKFNNYLKKQHEENINKVKILIQNYYEHDHSNSIKLTRELTKLAELEKLYIEIINMNGNTVFSSGKEDIIHKNTKNKMDGHMIRQRGLNTSDYQENYYDIVIEGKKEARLTIGYFGSFNVSNEDLIFKGAMNFSFIISAIIALIIAILFSTIISKKLSKPLTSLTNTANEIKTGNYKIRSKVNTKTKEIDDLSDSINYLADNLYKQEDLRKRLTSDLVHEIKTPLTIINNHIDAFLDGIWEADSEKLNSCKEEVIRLSKMVDSLKNIYMLEESKLNLNKSEFNLSQYIIKIIRTFKPIYLKKNIELKYDIEEDIIVFMDMDKIKQIIYNLLSNANRYTDYEGEVTISLEKRDSSIILKVKDNGIGISEKDMKNIFERFYRTDLSRNRETGGAGIGLTIVKTLTEAHEGKISVQSEEGKGSTFILLFPNDK
ncbi:HAMP domain-containing sensor histidine kinase [Clostridium sediminicola]|uniref:HAMP domain-containing sensor histidine kinase n=1 Tax=Clostridium sediminicola TaxID=3114879 RepID=UPI0031F264B3